MEWEAEYGLWELSVFYEVFDMIVDMKKHRQRNTAPRFVVKNEEELLRILKSEKIGHLKQYFRQKWGIPKEGYLDEKTAAQHLTREEAFSMFEELQWVLDDCRLPVNFKKPLYKNIIFNETWVPPQNFFIDVSDEFKSDPVSGEIIQYPKTISLVTFKALSTEEQKFAITKLAYFWKKYFPPHLSKRTRLRNIDPKDKYLLVEEMRNRKMKDVFEESSYLRIIKRDRGDSVYKATKKSNPNETILKESKRTSEDVAKDLYGTKKKAGAARTAYSRIKKKMEN